MFCVFLFFIVFVFFFKQKTAYEMRISDWSSDVCSSDLFAMAQQDIRYYLNGMLFVFEPGYVRAVATDGHRLAHSGTAVDGITARHDVIVPRKTVLEMQRLLGDTDEPVAIDVAQGQIRFRFGDRSEEHTSELQALMRI